MTDEKTLPGSGAPDPPHSAAALTLHMELLGDLAAAVAETCPGTVAINPDAPPDKRSYRVDFSRFRNLVPGHQPRTTLAASVARLVAGLRATGFNDPNFRASQRVRPHAVAELQADGLVDDGLRWTR